MIDPSGSERQLERSSDRSGYGTLALATSGVTREDPEFSQEYCICPGDEIYVLGPLQENPSARKDPVRESSSLSRIGPGLVSADAADLLRRQYFPALNPALPSGAQIAPLEQFDLASSRHPDERPGTFRYFQAKRRRDRRHARLEVAPVCRGRSGGCNVGPLGNPAIREHVSLVRQQSAPTSTSRNRRWSGRIVPEAFPWRSESWCWWVITSKITK